MRLWSCLKWPLAFWTMNFSRPSWSSVSALRAASHMSWRVQLVLDLRRTAGGARCMTMLRRRSHGPWKMVKKDTELKGLFLWMDQLRPFVPRRNVISKHFCTTHCPGNPSRGPSSWSWAFCVTDFQNPRHGLRPLIEDVWRVFGPCGVFFLDRGYDITRGYSSGERRQDHRSGPPDQGRLVGESQVCLSHYICPSITVGFQHTFSFEQLCCCI